MYGRINYNSPWKSGDESSDHDECSSVNHSFSDDDSEKELKELEELLYSQVHYVSNQSYKELHEAETDDIVITAVNDKAVETGSEQDKNVTLGSALHEVNLTLPAIVHKTAGFDDENVIRLAGHKVTNCCEMTQEKSASNNSSLKQGGSVCILVDSEDESTSLSADNSACIISGVPEVSVSLDHELLESSEVVKKHLKGFTSTPAVTKNKKVLTRDSTSSDSSYDAFCFEESSLDSFVIGGDTKINLDSRNTGESDAAQLKKIVNSLPGISIIFSSCLVLCIWQIS
jgi:hypothetical protein